MLAAIRTPAAELGAMKRAAVDRVRALFTWDTVASQTIQAIEGIVSAPAPPVREPA
jgi:hypothetical protein